jgi:hypothetical protein
MHDRDQYRCCQTACESFLSSSTSPNSTNPANRKHSSSWPDTRFCSDMLVTHSGFSREDARASTLDLVWHADRSPPTSSASSLSWTACQPEKHGPLVTAVSHLAAAVNRPASPSPLYRLSSLITVAPPSHSISTSSFTRETATRRPCRDNKK